MMFDITILSAFFGGLIVFFSPCVLPIVPFYLSYMAGASMAEITEAGAFPPGLRARAVAASIMFSAGIILVFVLLGAAAFGFSQLFRDYVNEFRWVAAGIVLLMGLHFLGVLRIPFLNRTFQVDIGDTRKMSVAGAFLVGVAFAAGWTPCVGGVLTGVIFTASQEATAWQGLVLMVVFGIGMTLPFVVSAFFVGPFLRFARKFRRHLPKVEKAMGLMLVLFAILIASGSINLIANWMIQTFPAFTRIA